MRQMFTGGVALALVMALSNTADAQVRGRANPYAYNVYYYQMAAAQQRAYYQAAQMQRQAFYYQRAMAIRQQQQFNALSLQAKQQLAAQVRLQQAFEMERMRAFHRAGRGGNMLVAWGDAIHGLIQAGPVGAIAALPLIMTAPIALIGGIVQALGGG